jgi:hypothetical protein
VQWRDIISAAMRLQSQNALGQAGLLIGPENLIRMDLPGDFREIGLDDWRSSVDLLPPAAAQAIAVEGTRIAGALLHSPAETYTPFYS